MKTSKRPTGNAWRNGFIGLALVASGPAMAASYNILLKANGAVQTCATGGFTFTKTTVGTFPTTGAAVTLSGTTAAPCFGVTTTEAMVPGALSVNVANVVSNGQDQGPNVVSIQGNLTSGNGNNNFTITFAPGGTFIVTRNTGQNPQVGTGTYFVLNTANAVPEPQTLGLVAAALGGLLLARRLRRRA